MTTTVTAVNQTQSLAAIRNFVRAAVSCITYARGLCSDNAYEQRPFLGLPLRQLIPSTAESITISEWIEKGAFDALNRNYLKEMSLCVYDAECQRLLESYCFSFNYTADGQRAQMSLNATQNTEGGNNKSSSGAEPQVALTVPAYRSRRCSKQEVQGMLTRILERLLDVVISLPPLLSARVLTMRLTYYDDVTPASYEPPCFAPASSRMQQLYQEEVKLHVHIGALDTSHHFFSVAIRHPLLQQVQARVTAEEKSGGEGSQLEGNGPHSAPLRSGLESTFSSGTNPINPPARAAVMQRGGDPQQRVRPSDNGSYRTKATVYSESDSDSDSSDAAATHDSHARRGDSGAARGTSFPPLDSVQRLVTNCGGRSGEAGAARPPQRPLKAREIAYLLLASFVFAQAPSVRGGRGRLTPADVEAFRLQSCSVELSAHMTRQMLEQLCREGLLVPEGGSDAVSLHGSTTQWTVPDPPLAILQPLLRTVALTQLLAYPCHVALEELCVYLEREEARISESAGQRRSGAAQKRKRSRH